MPAGAEPDTINTVRFQHFSTRFALIAALLTVFPLIAQDPVFRSSTQLVEVSVVAADGQGQPVTGLTKADFTIFEDGKPQQISHFLTAADLAAGGPPPKLPKGIFSNRPELLPHAPRTVTAIVIDYLNTPWAAQTATREQLLGFLRNLRDDDIVAVYTMANSLSILHDFTTDRKSLVEKLEKSPGLLTLNSRAVSEVLRMSSARWERAFSESRAQAENASRATLQRSRTLLTLDSLSLIARHLAGIPGRKNLIYLSSGFPFSILPTNPAVSAVVGSESTGYRVANMPVGTNALGGGEASLFLNTFERTVRVFADAGVSIYGIDPMGLVVPIAAAEVGHTETLINQSLANFQPVQFSESSLVELSSRTGGVSLLKSNHLERALNQALSDARNAYTIAYYSANQKFDGKERKIEVKLSRPNVKLRYRNAYTARKEGSSTSTGADLEEALRSPVTLGGILLTAQVQSPDPQKLDIALQIESRQLALKSDGANFTGSVELLFYQRTAEGKMAGQQVTLPLKLDAAAMQKVMQKGLVFRRSLERQKETRWLRIVVRDTTSGATGSLDVPFDQI